MTEERQLELPGVIDYRKEDWKLILKTDNGCESPRDWGSALGKFLVGKNCKYAKNEMDFSLGDYLTGYDYEKDKQTLEKMGYIPYPVSVYEHSGVRVFIGRANDWDSGCIGFYLVKKEDVYKEWNCKRISPKLRANINEIVAGEIDIYSHWLNGDCYGFKLFRNGEEVDSCWGFIGIPWGADGIVGDIYDCLPSEFTNAFTVAEAVEMAERIYD